MRSKYCLLFIFCISIIQAQVVSTFAGSGSGSWSDGTGTAASFNRPHGIAVDQSGNIYVADYYNNRIRKITPSGVVTTLAGGSYGYLDGAGSNAKFRYPSDVSVDGSGNVYVADSYNHRIRKITSSGVVSTIAGSGSTGNTNGTGTAARFNRPSGIAIDGNGIIYVADRYNHRIRTISASGEVTTFAGYSSSGYLDGNASDAKFYEPTGIDVDGSGNVYVADSRNHVIRKISSAGLVTTLAGYGGLSGSVNGTGTDARFYYPWNVCIDSDGVLYIADESNDRIRKITSGGVVSTIAGSTPGYADGSGTAALFNSPKGVSVFGTSHLYVADYLNNRIRSISLDSAGVTTEEIVFSLAGGGSVYNISTSTAINGSLTGGIKLAGSGFISNNSYLLKISFNQGNTWSAITATAATGTFHGSGSFSSDASGNIQLLISHSSLSSMAEWPGNDGTVTVRVSDASETFFMPNSSGQQFVLDLTQPSITFASIYSNNINNTSYAKLGDIVTVSFQSSEMLGNTVLPISGNINGNTVTVTGSGTAWQAFATVNNIDPEGISTFEITYYDVNGNAGISSITTTTNQSSVTIDKTVPLASNITIYSSNANNTQAVTGDTVFIEFSVNESLSNLTDTKINNQTILSSNIINTSIYGWRFWYIMQGGEKDGNVSFSFTANDIAGNGSAFNAANSGSVSFNADPVILSVSSSKNNGSYNAGEIIPITIQFIENVLVTGTPQLTIETGNVDAIINYTSGDGSDILVFEYVVSESDSSNDLDYTSSTALSLNGGSIQDSAGHNAQIDLPHPGSIYSLGYNKNIIIDNIEPVLTSVSTNVSNGTYNINDNIYIYAYFNESIYVTGSPKFEIAVQNGQTSTKTINYYSKSGSIAKFRYQVASGDTTSELLYTSANSLYLNNGTITDAAGNPAVITLPEPGSQNSLGGNRDIVVDGIAPVVLSVSSSSDNGIYKINDDIFIDIHFSQHVSVSGTPYINLETGANNGRAYYNSGSNTNKLRFKYNISSGHYSNDLEYISGSNALYGTIRDASYNSVIKDLPALGSQNSISGSSDIIIDGIIPTVTGVTSTAPDSTYKIGDVIDIQINFSESIDVTGTPQLTLETGVNDAVIDYISGSGGGDSLLFRYTVSSGHASIDLDYQSITSLSLNGGTVKDIARNPANLNLFSPDSTGSLAANKTIVVDGIIPEATSVSFVSNNPNLTSIAGPEEIVTLSLTTSEAIKTPTVTIGDVNATVTGNNTSWSISRTMSSNDVSGNIVFTIDYVDLAGNSGIQITSSTDGSAVIFDKTPPLITNVTSITPNGIYIVGQELTLSINFNELVKVTGSPLLQLETGEIDRSASFHSANYQVDSSIVFIYTVSAGDSSGDLDYKSTNSLMLNGGFIKDLAGNSANIILGNPGTNISLSGINNIIIDGILPEVTGVMSTAFSDSTYIIGDMIPIQITFDDYVSVTGNPELLLETGIVDGAAVYASGSGQNTLTFNYIVENGQISSDLGYVANSSLYLNGGYILDENGNQSDLTLPDPGSFGSLSSSSNIVIDGIMPKVNIFTASSPNGTYKIDDELFFTAVFSEIVNVTGDPQLLLETGGDNPSIALYNSGSGTTMLNFSYIVSRGDTSSDLDYYSQTALILNNGTIKDSVGNLSDLLLFDPGDVNSISGTKDIVIDGIPPSINQVFSLTQNGNFNENDQISLAVKFREPVDVSGIPKLTLDTSPVDAFAVYTEGTGSPTLSFSYTVAFGQNSTDLGYSGSDALSLNSSTIRDEAGNEADLLLPEMGASGSLSLNSDVIIDTEYPVTIFSFQNDYYNDSWGTTGLITGTVLDSISGVSSVDVQIYRSSDGFYFNGNNWLSSQTWLQADNTFPWSYPLSYEYLDNNQEYIISAKSIDAAGNVENTAVSDSFVYDMEQPVSEVVLDDTLYNNDNWSNDNTISGIASDSISGSLTVSILINNIMENTWWNDTSWSQEPNWIYVTGTNSWSYSLDNTFLSDGLIYHVYSRVQDQAGNTQLDSGFASFTYDISGPLKGQVKDGLALIDDDWSNDVSTISAAWTGFTDSTTELKEYLVALGSDSGGFDVVNWVSVNLDTYYVNNALDLQHGVTYYFSVRALDAADNISETAITDGITIDTEDPVIYSLYEGDIGDLDYQSSDSSLSLFASADDDFSGIISYSFAVGTAPGDTDVVNWTDEWTDSSIAILDLNLQHSVTYWGSGSVSDSAGNVSFYYGNGITIDLTSPLEGQVIDISSLDMEIDQAYTPSKSILMASWIGFEDSISGISGYEYSIINDGTTIVDWTDVGLDTFIIDSTILLSDGQIYKTKIRAIDRVGHISTSVSSDGITADLSGPFGNSISDGDSTDIDRQNILDIYSGYWDMFSDDLSGLEGHEYALFDLNDSIYYSEWQFTGLDTAVYLDNQNLLENHTYQLHVRGLDKVGNTGEIINSDGVFIDLSAPGIPSNLVGRFSSKRIELTWDPVLEYDFSHYNIYAGQDSNIVESIINSDTAFAQVFMPEYQDGEMYYFKVSSFDIAGNESNFSYSIGGIPQSAIITELYPDTIATIFRNDKVVQLKFSQPLISPGVPVMSSLVYDNMNMTSTYSDTDTTLTITILETIASLDTINLSIPGIVDWAGDTASEKQLRFHTYLLGDYDHDFHISVNDLASFVTAWDNQDITYELGPVTGVVPHLIPDLNNIFDMRDAMTLKRMWDWSNNAPPLMAAYQGNIGYPLSIEQSGRILEILLPKETIASEIVINYPEDVLDIVQSTVLIDYDKEINLNKTYTDEKKILHASGYIERGIHNQKRKLSFEILSTSEIEIPLFLGYKLIGESGIIAKGMADLRFVPTPEEFALYQNFPNPFNPKTRIKYDLIENSNVKLTIYDVSGREINQLINRVQEAGYHSILWNGRNRQGKNAGAGIYFYVIEANNFRQVRKMLLLK